MKIKTKSLGLIYTFVILFCISIVGLYFYLHTLTVRSVNNILIYRNELEIVSQLELALAKVVMPANDYLIHGKEEERYTFEYLDADVNKYFSTLMESQSPTHFMMEGKGILNKLKDQYVQIKALSVEILDLSDPIGNAEGAQLMEEMDLQVDNMLLEMEDLHKFSRREVLVEVEVINAYFYHYMIIVLSVLGVIIVVSLFYGFFLTKGIIVPLERLVEYMRYVAKGDFSRRLDIKSKDEIGLLTSSFNKMVDDLQVTTVSKNYVDNIIESTTDMLVVVAPDAVIKTVNRSLCNLLGYKEVELLDQPIGIIFDEDIIFKETKSDELIIKASVTGTERTYRSKDGRKIPVLFSNSIMRDSEGKIQGIVCMALDITKRKHAEEVMQRQYMEMITLNELTHQVSSRLTLDEVVKATLKKISISFTTDLALLFLKEGDNLLLQGAVSSNPQYRHETTPPVHCFGECLCGLAIKERNIMYSPDLHNDPRCSREECKNSGLHSFTALPLMSGEKMLGVLGLASSAKNRDFARQATYMKTISNSISIGLQNSLLYEDTRKYGDELAVINKELRSEIAERKRFEEQVIASLKEKEILLREIYHRTKNNMQVICSLLNLQTQYTKDEQVLKIFKETENRIKSMSLVHTKLYQSKDLSNVNLKSYIHDLMNTLSKAYHINPDKVSLKIFAEDILVSIDNAVPCGLIINEIITNSMKYAFPDTREGEIKINLCSTDKGEIELIIADNGIGMPKDFDVRNSKTLGLQLVFNLIKHQLEGKVEMNTEKGVEFQIKFKEPVRPKRI